MYRCAILLSVAGVSVGMCVTLNPFIIAEIARIRKGAGLEFLSKYSANIHIKIGGNSLAYLATNSLFERGGSLLSFCYTSYTWITLFL